MKIYERGENESLESVFTNMSKSARMGSSSPRIYCQLEEDAIVLVKKEHNPNTLLENYVNDKSCVVEGSTAVSFKELVKLVFEYNKLVSILGSNAWNDKDFRLLSGKLRSAFQALNEVPFNNRLIVSFVNRSGNRRNIIQL